MVAAGFRDHILTPLTARYSQRFFLRLARTGINSWSNACVHALEVGVRLHLARLRTYSKLSTEPATMSVTTAANTTTQSVLHLLADYELTHSGEEPTGSVPEPPNPRSRSEDSDQNPDWWPENYHGIPAHRPINYNLDRESRPWAQPGVETAFVWTMLNGVGIIAVCSVEPLG